MEITRLQKIAYDSKVSINVSNCFVVRRNCRNGKAFPFDKL